MHMSKAREITKKKFTSELMMSKSKARAKKRTESHTQRGQSDMRASESEIMAVFSLNEISDFDEEPSKKKRTPSIGWRVASNCFRNGYYVANSHKYSEYGIID